MAERVWGRVAGVLVGLALATLAGCSASGGWGPTEPVPGVIAGERCGGVQGIECQEGLWCDPDPGQCGGADLQGTCIEVPDLCTQEYAPVCGCNGLTYPNDCRRAFDREQANHEGVCSG